MNRDVIPLNRWHMATLQQLANEQRVLLLLEATTIPNAVGWADSKIEELAPPPIELIDVSMGGSQPLKSFAALFAVLAEQTDDIPSTMSAFGRLGQLVRDGKMDTVTVIERCYSHLRSEELLYVDPFMGFHNLSTDIAMIEDGYFGHDKLPEVQADLLVELDEMSRDAWIAE